MTENKPMKVKKLIKILQKYNQEANVFICYEHANASHCKNIELVCNRQKLLKNIELKTDENVVMIWGE